MYEWMLVLMEYINRIVSWEFKALRTDRMKFVLHEAAGIGERRNEKYSRQEERIR